MIFDLEKTLRRLDGNQELYQDLIRFFLEDSPVLLDRLRQGYREQDAQLVERAAHTLKGLAANFGASQPWKLLWGSNGSREPAAWVQRAKRSLDSSKTLWRCKTRSGPLAFLQHPLHGPAGEFGALVDVQLALDLLAVRFDRFRA